MSAGHDLEPFPLFARFLSRTMGLHFGPERYRELELKLAPLAAADGCGGVAQYLTRLMSAPLSREQLDSLAGALTVGETYFLRDPKSFRVLEKEILPELLAARGAERTLSIWSAGCSSGEEAYSIAILLTRAVPDLARWKVTLVGSDINPAALERARLGVFGKWSFRDAPKWLFDYFTRCDDGRYRIDPAIAGMVRFRQLNLADANGDGWPQGMDVVFCRNVMLYFGRRQIERTVARLHAALNEGGWLFVGPTEVDHHACPGFSCRNYEGALVLRKGGAPRGETGKRPPLPLSAAGSAGIAPAFPPEAARPRPGGTGAQEAPFAPAAPFAAPAAAPAPAPPDAPPSGNPAGGDPVASLPAAGEARKAMAEAEAAYDAGRYAEAARLAEQAALGALRGEALALAGRAHANIGAFAEARRCCEEAIACDRLKVQNHYLLSIVLEQQGDAEGAERSLKHALFLDHDYLLAYFALGNLCRQRGDRKESQRNYANALRLLERRHPHEAIPEAEGMTAGRLAELIRAMNS